MKHERVQQCDRHTDSQGTCREACNIIETMETIAEDAESEYELGTIQLAVFVVNRIFISSQFVMSLVLHGSCISHSVESWVCKYNVARLFMQGTIFVPN